MDELFGAGVCGGGAVKYRVIEREDGSYQTQYRCMLFWWLGSTHAPSADLEEQIAFANAVTDDRHKRRPKKKRVAWTPSAAAWEQSHGEG